MSQIRTRPCPPRLEPVALTGRFVRLEPLGRQHAADLVPAALSDPRIWDYMFLPILVPEDVEPWIEAALAEQSTGLALAFVVVDLASGRLVGSTRYLDYRPVHRGIEIGWTWYARWAWSTAVNPEAKLLLLRYAFETLGCMRVQLKTDERNLRSRAAITRLGAREEGILRKHMLVRHGAVRNSVYFSILDDEWPSVEAGLLARLAEAQPPSLPANPAGSA
jgi:RimJ/RimL family protein N-acetyltransferase